MPAHGFLESNLALLASKDRDLGARMSGVGVGLSWELLPAVDGLLTAGKLFGQGHYRYIHSRISPGQEAEQWAASVVDVCGSFVVLGFGLGYHISQLLKRNRSFSRLLIVEAEPELFRAALECVDLTGILNDGRVNLVVGTSVLNVKNFISEGSMQPVSYRKFLSATGLHPEFYREVEHILEELIFRYRRDSRDPAFAKNDLAGRGRITLCDGVSRLLEEMKE
ncbi:MAG: hypothetical protein PHT49_03875 [Desulfovibrionales bacterium]|nr:hypothetical protein [Desulfovibrionales bacterium]